MHNFLDNLLSEGLFHEARPFLEVVKFVLLFSMSFFIHELSDVLTRYFMSILFVVL